MEAESSSEMLLRLLPCITSQKIVTQKQLFISKWKHLLSSHSMKGIHRIYFESIVTCISDYRRGLDWWIYLLNTHRS
jgi:hypothetical protein